MIMNQETTPRWLKWLVAATCLLAVNAVFLGLKANNSGANRQVGLAEDYNPDIAYNGFNTAKPASFSNTVSMSGTNSLTGGTTMTSGTLVQGKIGQNGTALTLLQKGVCNIHGAATIAATSTATVDCQAGTGTQTAIPGFPAWAANDVMHIQFASTSPATVEGLTILGASPSTTAGFITMKIFNGTGATFTWTSLTSSSLPWVLFR